MSRKNSLEHGTTSGMVKKRQKSRSGGGQNRYNPFTYISSRWQKYRNNKLKDKKDRESIKVDCKIMDKDEGIDELLAREIPTNDLRKKEFLYELVNAFHRCSTVHITRRIVDKIGAIDSGYAQEFVKLYPDKYGMNDVSGNYGQLPRADWEKRADLEEAIKEGKIKL